ncbi:MAG TPA: hypothetical protein VJX72_01560 [Candidatus Acidoferrum sp.]|nr:hypothetical protein [Candidatus Acidoferrum sp.]
MQDKRNVLQVLQAEFAFLEMGGYRRVSRYPWRPNFVFEDSPTCINSAHRGPQQPCASCSLIEFVPENRRAAQFPCRHIPLTPRGETVNSFYEWGTEEELETALREWLLETIKELESDKKAKVQAASA